jgi:penicillin-binding protein 1A
LINDAPISFAIPGMEDLWRPENYSHRYMGPMRLRDALAQSRNVVSVRLLKAIGMKKALKHIFQFGFTPKQVPRELSIALGACSLTPLELTQGYSVFANGGFLVGPHFVERIETSDGQTVMETNPPTACPECEEIEALRKVSMATVVDENGNVTALEPEPFPVKNRAARAIPAQNAWIMNSMLQDVIRIGTGKPARRLNRRDIAGKTGTTNDHKDAWFAGFNGKMVATAWIGFDQVRSLGKEETGAHAALPMWMDFMKTALAEAPETLMAQPAGITTVRIDPRTGKATSARNPKGVFEVFRADASPKKPASAAPARRPAESSISQQLF